ncbi:MAG: LuxR C-terminal-related transcriptional regulator [Chloroflexota bacterium]
MTTPAPGAGLLLTKLVPPTLPPESLARPHLVRALSSALDRGCRLVLVSAPAGCGKTTLAAAWADGLARPDDADHPPRAPAIAWFSIDPADDDPKRFWRYVLASAGRALPGLGRQPARLLTLHRVSAADVVTPFLNEVHARSERLIVVLDDYQLIAEPSIHEGVATLLAYAPANLHIVLVTRADPPLPLSRLRARGLLYEVRAADLLFDRAELDAFLNGTRRLGLSPDLVDQVAVRTEGWAVAVQNAAASLADTSQGSPAARVGRLTGRRGPIGDFLVDEVLAHQPRDVGRLLAAVSIVDRVCGPLADAVVPPGDGVPAGARILEQLSRSNALIAPADADGGVWYRLHPLFREALHEQLLRMVPAREVAALHARASGWFAAAGLPEEAVEHALAADDRATAAQLADRAAEPLERNGRIGLLERWYDALGDDAFGAPDLVILTARGLMLRGRTPEARQRLDLLEARLARDAEAGGRSSGDGAGEGGDEAHRHAVGSLLALRATLSVLEGDAVAAREQADRALAALAADDLSRPAALLAFGDAAMIRDEPDVAEPALIEAMLRSRDQGGVSLALFAAGHLGQSLVGQGRLKATEAIVEQALRELATRVGGLDAPVSSLALIYAVGGWAARERDELDLAGRRLSLGLEVADRSTSVMAQVAACEAMAMLQRSLGDNRRAVDLVERALTLLRAGGPALFVRPLEAQRAQLWVLSGRLEDARRWAAGTSLDGDAALDYASERELGVLARLWLVDGRPDDAARLAGRLADRARERGRVGNAIYALVLRSLALQAAGDAEGAVAELSDALLLARPEGFRRAFLDEGRPMAGLLRRVAASGTPVAGDASRLLAAAPRPGLKTSSAPAAGALLVEPLTAREREVLALLSRGASNARIAEDLVVSVGTVKTHVAHLASKLGARTRGEAIAHAYAIGLLSLPGHESTKG